MVDFNEAIEKAWNNGVGIGEAQKVVFRLTGRHIDKGTIRRKFIALAAFK